MMKSRNDTIENRFNTKMKREKQSKQKCERSKKEKNYTLSPKSYPKSQNPIVLSETEKKGLTLTIVKDKDECFIKKCEKCKKPNFFSETPIPISISSSISDMSDSDLIVISDAGTSSSKGTSPEDSEVLSNFPIESKFVHRQNSANKLVKVLNKTNISPTTLAKQVAIKINCNISASSCDRILDIKENENVTSYESTFSQVNVLPEIEINQTFFSESVQPELLYSEGNSKLSLDSPGGFDINEMQNSNEDESGLVSPENCLSLLNRVVDAVVEPKEDFISNQLNIKSVSKPLDFSYESSKNAFLLVIDLSDLKAASNYLKGKSSALAVNEPITTSENFENFINEQINLDINIGANVECKNEFFASFSDFNDSFSVGASSSVLDGHNNHIKRKTTGNFQSTLSDLEKTETINIIVEPCKQLKVKTTGPTVNSIDASLNVDKHRNVIKRKRKRCIWDTKKRRCKTKNKPSQIKNNEAVEPVINDIYCDTCDEGEADELTGNNYPSLPFSELRDKEVIISSPNSHCQLNNYETLMIPNVKSIETKSKNEVFCDTKNYNRSDDLTENNCEILANSFVTTSQISVSNNIEVVKPISVELTGDGESEHFKLGVNSYQHNSIDNSSETSSCFDVDKSSNHCASDTLNKVFYKTHDDNELEQLTGDNCKILSVSNFKEKEEALKTGSDSCSQLDIAQSSLTNDSKVVEQILNPEVLDNTEEFINVNLKNSMAVELENENLGVRPDPYETNSIYKRNTSETSSHSTIDSISNHCTVDEESLNLMEDDLDFEPDDHMNVEILSKCSLDTTCTDVSVETPVSSETVFPATCDNSDKNNEVELYPEPNSKICIGFSGVIPNTDSQSCLTFTKVCETSQKGNYQSEDESDSDSEYNFKRTRREMNCFYKDECNNSNSSNFNENRFSVHEDVFNPQNEVKNCETPENRPSNFSHFSNSVVEHQDVLSHKKPNGPEFCSSKRDETLVKSSKSQGSFGNFYRLEDVVSKIKVLCNKKLVAEALQITETYIGLSSDNGIKNYLMQELFSSLLTLIHTNAKNNDFSITNIFDQVLEISENYHIDDRITFSKFIVECCSDPDLYFHSIKVLYSCKHRNILLKTAALKKFGSFLKAENAPLSVLLDFIHYMKSVCIKRVPKNLVHMALEKCNEYNYTDAHNMCLFLHNITLKEVDSTNLQEFLLLCFKHRMWADIADMFIAWDSKHQLLECFYIALASTDKNIGDYYKKLADSLFHGYEGKLSSYQKHFIGQIGTALMLCAFSSCNLQCSLEVLYTLHAHNFNYFQEMLISYKLYVSTNELDTSVMAFPYHVVFIAVDVCLHFKRPKDAFCIFQGFSWIVPDESLDESVKADVLIGRFQRILKLIPLLNNENSLNDGWEALKMLLLSAEKDFSLEDLKLYAKDMLDVYNDYLISVMNSRIISSLSDLYKHSFGPCKEIITIVPNVLRGLVVTFTEKGLLEDAKSVFMFGIIKSIYDIKRPDCNNFPWQLTIQTNWSVLEIKLAVEWFLDGLLPLLTDKPSQTDYEKWFSLTINFQMFDDISSDINCLKETPTDSVNAVQRAGEALQHLNPSLEFIEDTTKNILCIVPDSLYNFWKYNCPNASFSNFSNRKLAIQGVSFGKETDISSIKSAKKRKCRKNKKFENFTVSLTPDTSERIIYPSAFQPSNSNMPSTSKSSSNMESDIPQMECMSAENDSTSVNVSSSDLHVTLLLSAENRNSLRNETPIKSQKKIANECVPQLLNQNLSTITSIVPQVETVQKSNASHASVKSVSSSDVSPSLQQFKANKSTTLNPSKAGRICLKLNIENESVSQLSNQNSTKKPGILSQVESVQNSNVHNTFASVKTVSLDVSPSLQQSKADKSATLQLSNTNRISLIRAPIKDTIENESVSKRSYQNSNKKSDILPQVESVQNSNVSDTSASIKTVSSDVSPSLQQSKADKSATLQLSKANRISLKRHVAPIKATTANESVSKLSNQNSNKKLDIMLQEKSVQNSNVNCTSASIKTVSSDVSPRLQHSADKSNFKRISTSGNSSCKSEDSNRIIQFLKIKVKQKYKNLSPFEQHQKAVSLTETFIMDNSFETMDKKVMKLLTEFAVLHV